MSEPRTALGRWLDSRGLSWVRIGLGLILTAALSAGLAAALGVFKERTGIDVPLAPPVIDLDVFVPGEHPEPATLSAHRPYEGLSYEGPGAHAAHAHDDAEHAEGNGRRWPTDRITYYVDLAGVGRQTTAVKAAIRGAFAEAWSKWTRPLKLEAVEVDTAAAALVRHRFGPIDGPFGTLAWSYLADGTLRPKEQLYDAGERWTTGPPDGTDRLSIPTVAGHEIGHVLALAHRAPPAGDLMDPTYSEKVTGPTAGDVGRAVSLGYRRR